jgi:hypothetical protein
MAEQNANSVAITGGTINGTTIGATTPATGVFTTLTAQTEVLKGTGQNLTLYSQDYTNAAWAKSNLTVTASGATAPDSTSTAITVLETVTNGTHNFATASSVTSASGSNYTISFYLKANGRNFCAIYDGASAKGKFFNITAGGGGSILGNLIGAPVSAALVYVGSDWYRASIVVTAGSAIQPAIYLSTDGTTFSYAGNVSLGILVWGAQLEIGSTLNTYIPTTTTAVYGTPTLSFSGVSTIGLESNGSLFVQPAGTGALQAQATTSSAVGGNARGANAVDWSTSRYQSNHVASGLSSVLAGGYAQVVSGSYAGVLTGNQNIATAAYSTVVGGVLNNSGGFAAFIGSGQSNSTAGYYNFVGGGFTNSGTSGSAVTTQSGTMNGTTAVTLSGSNASIKVGQYITGTSIAAETYVAAISGTSLTLSKVASGSSTSTLSFFTPHGVVVGGGNNQATGSYSFIGGGGDAGTAANRNVASGDWSFVGGGIANQATGLGSVVVGGGVDAGGVSANIASGVLSTIVGGQNNQASGRGSFIGGGYANRATGVVSSVLGGTYGTTRGITANMVFAPVNSAIASATGVSQTALLILAKQTTDATATVLVSDNNSAGTSNQIILPNNSAYYFKGSVIANVTGAANGASWSFEGAIMRGANAASTVLIGTPAINRVAATAGATAWAIALTADTTNGGLAVTVTGAASTTIRWVCSVNTTECTF